MLLRRRTHVAGECATQTVRRAEPGRRRATVYGQRLRHRSFQIDPAGRRLVAGRRTVRTGEIVLLLLHWNSGGVAWRGMACFMARPSVHPVGHF